jgi:glucokinase
MAGNDDKPLALIGDIGGTNARFALTDPAVVAPRLLDQKTLPTAEFASLQQAAGHYLRSVDVAPRRACLAVACPVGGEEIRLTNRTWAFNREELRHTLRLDELLVVNDFGAVARAVPALSENEREILYGPLITPPRGPISVLGPGTGLGVALLIGDQDSGWHVVETEGGHVSFAPQDTEERQIAEWLADRHGRVSNERLLSGIGLSQIDAALAGRRPGKSTTPDATLRAPAEIVAAALAGNDVPARRTLARFCAILGSVSGDMALGHGAHTIAIAGGIVPRFIPFLRSSAFRERFLNKGRFAVHLESVAIEVVTHPAPGLLGAALLLRAGRPGGRSS